MLSIFESFDADCLPILLRYYEQADAKTKRQVLRELGVAGGNDMRVMEILQDALTSEHAQARINATAGMWAATKDLSVHVPLLMDRVQEALQRQGFNEDGTNDQEKGGVYLVLGLSGSAGVFCVHLAERGKAFVAELERAAQHEDADRRRILAYWIGLALHYKRDWKPVEGAGEDAWQMPDFDVSKLRPIINTLAEDKNAEVRKMASSAMVTLDEILADEKSR